MSDAARRRSQVRLTVFALFGLAALFAGAFVRQFIAAERLDPDWLRERHAVLFETPRALQFTGLIDEEGQAVDRKRFDGHWSLLFFGYSYCPDVCPTTLATLKQTLGLLPQQPVEDRPQVFLVSVDPARDTPAQLKRYVEYFDPAFGGITGEFLDVHRFASAVNVAFRKVIGEGDDYLVDHSAHLVLLNRRGEYAGFIKPPFEVARLAEVIRAIERTY